MYRIFAHGYRLHNTEALEWDCTDKHWSFSISSRPLMRGQDYKKHVTFGHLLKFGLFSSLSHAVKWSVMTQPSDGEQWRCKWVIDSIKQVVVFRVLAFRDLETPQYTLTKNGFASACHHYRRTGLIHNNSSNGRDSTFCSSWNESALDF